MRADEARNYLDRATARVEAEDRHLLEVNVSEWCIAARLAMYLREYFWDFDVDVEYNRDGDEVKRLHDVVRDCPRDRDDGHRVLPDVIVHRRGLRGDSNLLVIEMKKNPGKGARTATVGASRHSRRSLITSSVRWWSARRVGSL